MLERRTKAITHWFQLGAVVMAALAAFQIPACGGVMMDSGSDRDGGGTAQGGSGFIGGGPGDPGNPPPVGVGARPPKVNCGNGKIDPGEACDGPQLNGATCGTATMGTRPSGAVSCSNSCTFNLAGCRAYDGAGGVMGVGGFRAAGGYYGAGGFGSVEACYTSGGVPVSSGGCTYGSAATEQCLNRTNRPNGSCSQGCGCKVCPSTYARCLSDGGCEFIFSCAESVGCTNLAECYKLGCAAIIDRAGGLNSVGARYAEASLACLSQNGCPVTCPIF